MAPSSRFNIVLPLRELSPRKAPPKPTMYSQLYGSQIFKQKTSAGSLVLWSTAFVNPVVCWHRVRPYATHEHRSSSLFHSDLVLVLVGTMILKPHAAQSSVQRHCHNRTRHFGGSRGRKSSGEIASEMQWILVVLLVMSRFPPRQERSE